MHKSRKFSLRQFFLYGTLTRTVYKDISQLMSEENNSTLNGVAIMTTVFGALLSLLSFFGVLKHHVLPAYLFLFFSSLLLVILRKIFRSPGFKLSYFICFFQSLALLTFGILNSAIFAPSKDSNGTIFVVVLLVVPFIFTDVPSRLIPLLLVSSTVYCLLIRHFKAPSVVALDTVNTIFVFFIACVCNWIFATRNMRNLANRLYIEKERDTDFLTGLLTKQSARIITTAELSHGSSGVFVIIDLDDFKKVNDTYGHLYGDEVLVKVANCIKQNTRRTDVVARFGGDEFTIFFPDMDVSVVERKISDLFTTIDKTFADEKVHITCSVGIKSVSQGMEYDSIFNAADSALYHSKRSGKNRFSISDSPSAMGEGTTA